MVARYSRLLARGSPAPPFELPDTLSGRQVALEDFSGSPALVVAFLCNHCPYVKHLLDGFIAFVADMAPQKVAVVAISSNDAVTYPTDGPEEMRRLGNSKGFTFPYLYDESQSVARGYGAICTPDFFLYDRELRLAYHGQFDASRPGGKVPVSGADLRSAVDGLLHGRAPAAQQVPSIGCSIKWKAGQAPDWA